MTSLRAVSRAAALFLLGLLPADTMSAHYFRTEIDMEAGKNEYRQPYYHSYANAELFADNGDRVYGVECILGHAVSDLTLGSTILEIRVINSNGYLSSTTRYPSGQDREAQFDHCYGGSVAAHANAYNRHQVQHSNEACVGPPPIEKPEKYTPVLLDLETDGFHLSAPDPAVSFDLNADGNPERTAWTSAGEDDAFLCMDRNGNGVIDDGQELFGSATPLISGGTDESGYSALIELDWPIAGGNSDGQIDANDPMFDRLCVWVDANRDGVSQRREIQSLEKAGVVAFEGRYKKMHKKDDFGNLFRYTSRVSMRSRDGSVISWPTFDVIFAVP